MTEVTGPHAATHRQRGAPCAPIKLVVALTHPIQYYAPWFAFIDANCPAVSLEVVYATEPSAAQQGAGFGSAFHWDVPLRDGYQSSVMRQAAGASSLHYDRFLGLDVPELAQAVLDREPDVVLVPGWHSITYVRVLRACRNAGIPVLYRGDSNLLTRRRGWKRRAWAARTGFMLRHYAAYLSVGQRATEYLRSFRIAAERIFGSPHCVDNSFFAAHAAPWDAPDARLRGRSEMGVRPDEFVVLFVGKLEPNKRLRDVILAMAAAGGEYHLFVAGAGEEQASMQAFARETGVRVTWLGFVNQSALGRVYRLSDCLVLPGPETWGLVVNEALATGLPCVVSDAAGCGPDLITPAMTGECYPCGDAPALARALARVRDGVRRGLITRRACTDRADQYSFRQATDGILAASQFVLGAPRQLVAPPHS